MPTCLVPAAQGRSHPLQSSPRVLGLLGGGQGRASVATRKPGCCCAHTVLGQGLRSAGGHRSLSHLLGSPAAWPAIRSQIVGLGKYILSWQPRRCLPAWSVHIYSSGLPLLLRARPPAPRPGAQGGFPVCNPGGSGCCLCFPPCWWLRARGGCPKQVLPAQGPGCSLEGARVPGWGCCAPRLAAAGAGRAP